MIRRCAWCKEILGVVEPLDDERFTDGICARCQTEHFPETVVR